MVTKTNIGYFKMGKFFQNKEPYILFIAFAIFYTLQIPNDTYKADVLTFAIRSSADSPILSFAYLNSQTLLTGTALPNYHIGHTLILWLVYQIVPETFMYSIWTAGFVSSISAAFVVVLTYLIWLTLGIDKRKSIFIAVTFGLVPIFWEHATIGEIHALQMLFILLFLYSFFKEKYVFSALAFLFANLISPLSGLAFLLVFLKGFNKKNLIAALTIGTSALALYIVVFLTLGSDLLQLLNPVSEQPAGRGIIYRILTLGVFICLNFGFFIYFSIRGFENLLNENKNLLIRLVIASIPQVLLVFVSAAFFIEYGSFQILLFWAIAFPTGYYLSKVNLKSFYFIFSFLFSISITYFLLLSPHKTIGSSLEDAGNWLNSNGYKDVCVIGPWNVGINIISARNSEKLESLKNYYFDKAKPTTTDLIQTEETELIIAASKKRTLRKLLSDANIPGFVILEYNPIQDIEYGKVKKLYENEFVCLYSWEK